MSQDKRPLLPSTMPEPKPTPIVLPLVLFAGAVVAMLGGLFGFFTLWAISPLFAILFAVGGLFLLALFVVVFAAVFTANATSGRPPEPEAGRQSS